MNNPLLNLSCKSKSKLLASSLNNNLNSAEACAIIEQSNLSLDDWKKVDELFGLKLIKDTPDVDSEIYDLLHERQTAREARDFAKSDEIRDKLLTRGIAIRDTADGAIWQYAE